MILNIMGLLGVPKSQNMYTLTKTQRGNVNGNVHGNLPKGMSACMITRSGTWERAGETQLGTSICEVWTRMGNFSGNRGTGWDITFANEHHLHTIFVIFINSCLRTNLHVTCTCSVPPHMFEIARKLRLKSPTLRFENLGINACTPHMMICHCLQCAHIAILVVSTTK